MDDLRRHDQRRLAREALDPVRLLVSAGIVLAIWVVFVAMASHGVGTALVGWAILIFAHLYAAKGAAERKKWTHPRMASLWAGCEDRMDRFEEVLKKMRKDQIADLHEMPQTIRGVSQSLYIALRRADNIKTEVDATELGMIGRPPTWEADTRDAQSRELYRLADRNIAEYRGHFAAIMAGVQRTEAQSAVFMTTLDSLRMKLIGYRLVGRSPEIGTGDFLTALAEARTQLQAIDTALDELDLGHYPKTVSVLPPPMPSVPPPIPDDAQQRLNG